MKTKLICKQKCRRKHRRAEVSSNIVDVLRDSTLIAEGNPSYNVYFSKTVNGDPSSMIPIFKSDLDIVLQGMRGVYILMLDEILVYVGITRVNTNTRVSEHSKRMPFNEVWFIPFKEDEDAYLDNFEDWFIAIFCPVFNKASTSGCSLNFCNKYYRKSQVQAIFSFRNIDKSIVCSNIYNAALSAKKKYNLDIETLFGDVPKRTDYSLLENKPLLI